MGKSRNKRINFWSGPRNLSTAIMYSFAQRSDMAVVDEPFYAYYLKHSNKDHPGKDEVLSTYSGDYNTILEHVILKDYGDQSVFFKQMAHHVADADLSFCKECKNVILLRDPAEMIISFSKVIKDPTIKDLGLEDLHTVQHYLEENEILDAVFDSGDLLKDPEQMLRKLCDALQLEFDNSMLSWQAGPLKEDGCWAKYWYSNVHRSTGFKKVDQSATKEVNENQKELLNVCNQYYEQMSKNAIKLDL